MNMHATITSAASDRTENALAISRETDADFWAAHARWKKIDAEWDAALEQNPNLDDASFSEWGNRHKSAFDDMIAAPISTVLALAVKMEVISEGPDTQFRDTRFSLFDVVRFDAERLAKNELLT